MLVRTVRSAKAYSVLRFCRTLALSEEVLSVCPFIKNVGVATMDWELQVLIFVFWFFSS